MKMAFSTKKTKIVAKSGWKVWFVVRKNRAPALRRRPTGHAAHDQVASEVRAAVTLPVLDICLRAVEAKEHKPHQQANKHRLRQRMRT
jgi:hypothetical protein